MDRNRLGHQRNRVDSVRYDLIIRIQIFEHSNENVSFYRSIMGIDSTEVHSVYTDNYKCHGAVILAGIHAVSPCKPNTHPVCVCVQKLKETARIRAQLEGIVFL